MKNENKSFTVKRGRHGFDGNSLAEMSIKDATAHFKHIDARIVKDAHAEAVKVKKENDKKASKKN